MAVAPKLPFFFAVQAATLMFPATNVKYRSVRLEKAPSGHSHRADGAPADEGYDRAAAPMRRKVMTTPVTSRDFRKKAAEFERIAEQAISVEYRNTMLYLATRWHALADDVEAQEKRR